jgi:hypothetical protein
MALWQQSIFAIFVKRRPRRNLELAGEIYTALNVGWTKRTGRRYTKMQALSSSSLSLAKLLIFSYNS